MGLAGVTPERKNLEFHKRNQAGLIAKYFSGNSLRKLQIGAQANSIAGWLNVDISPKERSVCFMDATVTFPFADSSFDYVFSEHMIEHISFDEAVFMVKECYRILRPGGKIRIATPNLDVLAAILNSPDNPDYAEYISHYHQRFFPEKPCHPAFVINKLFYSFHHRFIHNFDTLKYILAEAGFTSMTRCEVSQSQDPELRNLEQHWREMGEVPNRVETIVIEAVK